MNKLNKANPTSMMVCISLLIIFLMPHSGFARQSGDWESWSSIELEYKPIKKLTLEAEGQLRLKENFSLTDQYFSQLGISYKIFGGFRLGGGLRYIRNNDTQGKIQGYENHFRFHLDLSYRHKLGPLLLKYRVRYQTRDELGVSPAQGDVANRHIRFKTTLTYKIKNWKLDPLVSAELFRRIEEGQESEFDKYRLTLGTNLKIKKLGKIGLFYRMERTLNEIVPITVNILKLKYTYSF